MEFVSFVQGHEAVLCYVRGGKRLHLGLSRGAWSAALKTVGRAHSLGCSHLDFAPLFIFSKKNHAQAICNDESRVGALVGKQNCDVHTN